MRPRRASVPEAGAPRRGYQRVTGPPSRRMDRVATTASPIALTLYSQFLF